MFGIVTNRKIPGNELIQWYRDRCGKSEEIHAVEKADLAGGRFPSKLFGANAAWWAIMILSYNLNAIMQKQVLPAVWKNKRFKGLRYGFICIAGRVIRHARQLIIKISSNHPGFNLLLNARITIGRKIEIAMGFMKNKTKKQRKFGKTILLGNLGENRVNFLKN